MESEFKIEKGVPIPHTTRTGSGRHTAYPFAVMEVGDSFFAAANGIEPEKFQRRISGVVWSWRKNGGRNTGFKFTTRQVEGGTRVWRIA